MFWNNFWLYFTILENDYNDNNKMVIVIDIDINNKFQSWMVLSNFTWNISLSKSNNHLK